MSVLPLLSRHSDFGAGMEGGVNVLELGWSRDIVHFTGVVAFQSFSFAYNLKLSVCSHDIA